MRLSGELKVDLSRLKNNFTLLNKIAPNNKIIFMVKANAYGHGLLDIVSFANNEVGIDCFGVAGIGEAKAIRTNLPQLAAKILVFSDTQLQTQQAKELYLEYNIVPVISNLDDLKLVLGDRDFKHIPLYLKFNTGMNRLGLEINDLPEVISLLKKSCVKSVEHLMTHFASSYLPLKKDDRTHRQYEKFKFILNEFKDKGFGVKETSCANSGAIEQKFGLEHSHIRPGLMLYGPKAWPNSNWGGECISTLKTKIIKISAVKKGTPVGYGGHVCAENGHLVYVVLGYGDGILTYYAGRKILLYDTPTKILGRVNMDITTFFFKELPAGFVVGGEFCFWQAGESNITEFASQLNTTAYQVFTAISSRVPRRYLA